MDVSNPHHSQVFLHLRCNTGKNEIFRYSTLAISWIHTNMQSTCKLFLWGHTQRKRCDLVTPIVMLVAHVPTPISLGPSVKCFYEVPLFACRHFLALHTKRERCGRNNPSIPLAPSSKSPKNNIGRNTTSRSSWLVYKILKRVRVLILL